MVCSPLEMLHEKGYTQLSLKVGRENSSAMVFRRSTVVIDNHTSPYH